MSYSFTFFLIFSFSSQGYTFLPATSFPLYIFTYLYLPITINNSFHRFSSHSYYTRVTTSKECFRCQNNLTNCNVKKITSAITASTNITHYFDNFYSLSCCYAFYRRLSYFSFSSQSLKLPCRIIIDIWDLLHLLFYFVIVHRIYAIFLIRGF